RQIVPRAHQRAAMIQVGRLVPTMRATAGRLGWEPTKRPGVSRVPRWVWILAAVAVVVIVAAVIVFVCVHRKSDDNIWNKALAKLETLAVKGRAPQTGYSRDAFGPPWTDDVNVPGGHNRCDTRDDILRRDLTDRTSRGCAVLSGTLHDPYTGTTIA